MARNYDYNGDPCGEFGTALREVNKLQDEIARLRLTDEEREAIERLCEAVAEYSDIDRKANGCHADDDMAAVDVARGLMKRMD